MTRTLGSTWALIGKKVVDENATRVCCAAVE